MEITEREAKLLRYLKTHKKPISCEKLADLCGLSADTARRELGRLSVCLNAQTGCQIAGRRGQGYRLIVTQPQQVEAFFNELAKQYHLDVYKRQDLESADYLACAAYGPLYK